MTNKATPASIYQKMYDRNSKVSALAINKLTDEEVMVGREFFDELSFDLQLAGADFNEAYKRALNAYNSLNHEAWSRSLIWIPDR